MVKKVMLTVPEDLYRKLEEASERSLRPVATEALYRMRLGLVSGGAEELPVGQKEEWVGPIFKDNKLNKKVYES